MCLQKYSDIRINCYDLYAVILKYDPIEVMSPHAFMGNAKPWATASRKTLFGHK